MQLTFVVDDLLTLKLLIFSLVIAYFGNAQITSDRTIFIKIYLFDETEIKQVYIGLIAIVDNCITKKEYFHFVYKKN